MDKGHVGSLEALPPDVVRSWPVATYIAVIATRAGALPRAVATKDPGGIRATYRILADRKLRAPQAQQQ